MALAGTREVTVQGMSLPHFHGKEDEPVDMFLWQATQYFEAKNFNLTDPAVQARCVTTLVANFRGNASFWFRNLVKTVAKPTTLAELQTYMEAHFTPGNLQNSLRDQLYGIRQDQYPSLFTYVSAYRQIIHQVEDMSERDRVGYFVRGLQPRTQASVKYHAPATLDAAITMATNFVAAHAPVTTPPTAAPKRHEPKPRTMEYPRSNQFAQPPPTARTPTASDFRGSSSADTRPSNYSTRTPSGSGGSQFGSNRFSQDARRPSTPSSSGPLRTSNKYDAAAAKHHLCFNCHSRNHRSIACDLPKRHASDTPKFFNRVVTQNTVRFVDHRRQFDDDSDDDDDFFYINVAQQSTTSISNLLKVQVRVNGHDCVALVDSGASHDMMDHRLVTPVPLGSSPSS